MIIINEERSTNEMKLMRREHIVRKNYYKY
jgi:hypothetical protein